MQASAIGLGALTQVAPDAPVRLAMTAFAFEHLEIATYRMLARLAQRAGDAETVAVAERILEQERPRPSSRQERSTARSSGPSRSPA